MLVLFTISVPPCCTNTLPVILALMVPPVKTGTTHTKMMVDMTMMMTTINASAIIVAMPFLERCRERIGNRQVQVYHCPGQKQHVTRTGQGWRFAAATMAIASLSSERGWDWKEDLRRTSRLARVLSGHNISSSNLLPQGSGPSGCDFGWLGS